MASKVKYSHSCVAVVCMVMVILPSSLACMCSSSHPQEQFCRAGFALSGRILKKTPVDDMRLRGRFGQFVYTVAVERVYKGTVALKEGVTSTTLSILTSPGDSLCGPHNLKIGTKYLITGSVKGGELFISSCDWVSDWRDVSLQQRQGLKTFYKKSCDICVIQSTMRAWQRDAPSTATSGCIYDPAPSLQDGVEDCQALYATCTIQEGSCQWYHRGDDFQQCIARNRPYYQGGGHCRDGGLSNLR